MNTWEELFLQWLCIKNTNKTNNHRDKQNNQIKKLDDIEIEEFPDLDFVESKVYECRNLKNEVKIY